MREWDYRDVAIHLDDLAEHEAQKARDSENLAMLVDRDDFELNFDYTNAVTDPDDPEVKAKREQRERLGIKPPPLPILRPVAHRKPEITAEMVTQYREAVAEYQPPQDKPNGGGLATLRNYLNS